MSSEGSVLTLRESRRPGVWARGQACVLPAAARRCGGRTRVLSSLSPDVLLSGLCISVPFHPQINPLLSWASRGSPASLGGGGHGPCGLRVVLPPRKGAEGGVAGRGGGSHVRCLPGSLPRRLLHFQVEKIDIEVLIAIGGALLIAALVLMCCFLCVYCKLAKVLR